MTGCDARPRASPPPGRPTGRGGSACPVLGPCRQHALAHREWYGVWGRLGERERQAMRAERNTETP
ncbi:MAG: WhiB family transcriptional regulator [Actinomycetes bacterium]